MINTKKVHFVVTTGTNLFPKCRKAMVLWVPRMSGLDPEFGIKMMEINVAKIMLHLINNAEINAR